MTQTDTSMTSDRRTPPAARWPPWPATSTPAQRFSLPSRTTSSRRSGSAPPAPADLANPGQFKKVQVGRESVLVVRGKDGALRAFLNVCRHRGAALCTESEGQVKRSLQCPYHAWTYALDGKLIAAPNLASLKEAAGEGIDRVQVRPDAGRADASGSATRGCAWPTSRRRSRTTSSARSPDASAIPTPSTTTTSTSSERRPPGRLRRGGQLEAHRRELHGVLPLRHDPPRAHRGAARVRQGSGRAVLRRSRRRVRFERSHGFTIDGGAGFDTLPGVTEDQDRRYYAITVKPTVFVNLVPDHIIFHRMYPMRRGPHDRRMRLALHRRTWWSRAATSRARSSCSTGSTSRTSTPASAPSPRCRRAPIATAAYSFLPNTTSRSSTSG